MCQPFSGAANTEQTMRLKTVFQSRLDQVAGARHSKPQAPHLVQDHESLIKKLSTSALYRPLPGTIITDARCAAELCGNPKSFDLNSSQHYEFPKIPNMSNNVRL